MEHVPLPSGERLAVESTVPADPGRPWIVYLHGLGAHRSGEKALYLHAELQRRGFGFVRFDFRGHGDSDGALHGFTLGRQIEDTLAVLDHLQERQAVRASVLVGSSLGGLTAAWCAALHPERVLAQVLIAPAFGLFARVLGGLTAAQLEDWRRSDRRTFHGEVQDFELGHAVVRDQARFDERTLAERTCRPTYVVHGREDAVVPYADSADFAARCPAPRPVLHPIEGGDHRLREHQDRVRDVVLECLRAVVPPSPVAPPHPAAPSSSTSPQEPVLS